MEVGRGGVGAPRRGVQRPPGGTGGDRVASDARLVLALVREEGVVVDVAHRVQPAVVDGPHPAGLVDLQPGARGEAHRLQADVVGQWRSANGKQHFVSFELPAVVQ